MSGIYSAPRLPILNSSELIKAVEALATSEVSETHTPGQNYFIGLKRDNLVVQFPEPAPNWQYKAPFAYPQVGSIYVSQIGTLVLASPLRVQADWDNIDTHSIVISFNGVECAGYAILV